MFDESLLGDLVSRWQHHLNLGRDLPADELCPERPELADELQRRIDAVRQMNRVVEDGCDTAPDATRPPSAPAPPASSFPDVPGYEIVDLLGRGGMGVVYKARQKNLNRLVALKMIVSGSNASVLERARFRTESEAIARLHHPNIVQIHEVGELPGDGVTPPVPFFSFEFCAGGSLEKKLRGTPLPVAEAVALVEALAHGLQAAHEKEFVHRDLKPANILLDGTGTPKLTDFGLAKKLDEPGYTGSGAVLGTPPYMAPEQARGESDRVGPSADIYALGVLLYEGLTGRPPFKAATGAETLLQVLHDEPVPPARLQRGVPRDLNTICLKCLQKESFRRYPSAAAVAEDLRRFRVGEPILGRPVRAVERAWRWCVRKPLVAALMALLVVVIGGSAFGLTAFYVRSRERAAVEGELRETFGMLIDALRAGDPLGVHEATFYTPSDVGLQRYLKPFLDRAAERRLEGEGVDPVTRAELLDLLGSLNRNLGRYKEAEPLLLKAVAMRRQHLGLRDPDYALSLHNLAWLHHSRGRYAEAEPLYHEALALRLKAKGDDDAGADLIRFHLAWLLIEMGDFTRSEEELRVVAYREAHYGEKSREAGIADGAIAGLYLDSGAPLKAARHTEKCVAIIQATDGAHSLGIVVTDFQAGFLARGLGNLNLSEEKFRHAADVIAQQLGERHAYMALILHEFAVTQEAKKDFDAAEATYRRCLDVTRQSVGFSHPKAAVAVASAGSLLSKRGKIPEADALHKELIAALRERYDGDHPLVADALVERSRVLWDRRDETGEREVLMQARAIYRTAGGTRHRQLTNCLLDLGLNSLRQKKYAEAEALFAEALPLAKNQYGDKHAKYAGTLAFLAGTQLHQNKLEGVEEKLQESYKIANAPFSLVDRRKPAVLDVLGTFGLLYRKTNRLGDAEAMARRRDEARDSPVRLYESACDLALLSAQTHDATQKRRCADEAVKVLQRALDAGYRNVRQLQTDDDLAALRGRADFDRLIVGANRERLPAPTIVP